MDRGAWWAPIVSFNTSGLRRLDLGEKATSREGGFSLHHPGKSKCGPVFQCSMPRFAITEIKALTTKYLFSTTEQFMKNVISILYQSLHTNYTAGG